MALLDTLVIEAGIAARALSDALTRRSLRLGVTGLSKSGKTVFITALVNNLLNLPRLPVFEAAAEGRIARVRLEEQPDDVVPRFPYEEQWARLTASERAWPQSTRRISQLRLAVDFESARSFRSRPSTLTLDLIDYPGEWLLDLSLIDKSYADWSRETFVLAEETQREAIARPWLSVANELDPERAATDEAAARAAASFTAYLRHAREDAYALSTLPPGRFLMPGDLEGSPALTFAPLRLREGQTPRAGSLGAMMVRRYEAYRTHVARPFFVDHFARLDRQIVVVDALGALNSGPVALRDLQQAMIETLKAFRVGQASWLASIVRPRVDRILFAATRADHLHHSQHDRLEAIVRLLADEAILRAEGLGAEVDVVALASIRATREAEIRRGGRRLAAVVGVPESGQKLDGQTFDGLAEVATFPGELPVHPREAFAGGGLALPETSNDVRFLRFRPPVVANGASAASIRLDRTLQFLIGDKLR